MYFTSPNEAFAQHHFEWNVDLEYIQKCDTLGPAYNEQKDTKETVRYNWIVILTKLFTLQPITLL